MNKNSLPKWKNLNKTEKILTIFATILASFILILALLDAFEITKSIMLYEPFFILLMAITSILYFKYDKKRSILFIICGVLVLVSYILMIVL